MKTVYISLGSNLNNPLLQLKTAIYLILHIPYSTLSSISSFHNTQAYGLINQPNYLNAVIELQTFLNPFSILYYLHKIEKLQGRKRQGIRWGPRIIDLDILLFNNLSIKSDQLVIPHYDIKNRLFFLLPLLEIAPNVCFPNGKKIKDLNIILKYKKFKIKKIN